MWLVQGYQAPCQANSRLRWRIGPLETLDEHLRLGSVWQGWSAWTEIVRGHFVNFWKWDLSCNGDPRTSEMSGLCDICQGLLQACGEVARRESVHAAVGRAGGVKLSRPFETQLTILWAPDAGQEAAGFAICPVGFRFYFGVIVPCYALVLSFLTIFPLWLYMLEVCNLFFFSRSWQLRDLGLLKYWNY